MRELLKQALDALEIAYPKRSSYISNSAHEVDADKHDAVVRAILAALAKPEQEPVAWMYDFEVEGETIRNWLTTDYEESHSPTMGCHNITPLYLAAGAKEKTE